MTLSVFLDQYPVQHQVIANYTNHRPAGLPTPNPTRSFWLEHPGANPLATEGSLGELTRDADVCIIGSGITGVSAAYHLARAVRDGGAAPLSAVILEAREFCSGATGRNGGHLMPYTFFGFRELVAKHGVEQAIRSYALEDHTVSSIKKLLDAEKLADAVDLVPAGRITLLFSKRNVSGTRADFDAAKDAGVDVSDVEWIEREDMLKRYGADYPGVRSPSNNIYPLKLVTQLYRIAKSSTPSFALHLHTRTPVTGIITHPIDTSPNARRWVLTTPRGRIACRHIIHATNAYASHLLPHLSAPPGPATAPTTIIPVRGQVAAIRATRPLHDLTRTSWTANEGFEYWFPRPVADPRTDAPLVVLGGGREAARPGFEIGVEDDGVVNPVVGRTLRRFLHEVFPDKFGEREPEMEWTGIMGFTRSGYPLVGPVPDRDAESGKYDGQYISAGYNGHGMTRAFACAEVVVGMLLAEHAGERWDQPEWCPDYYLTWSLCENGGHRQSWMALGSDIRWCGV